MNPQNSSFFPENLGKVPENRGEVSSKSRKVFPENLGKSDSKSWGSLFFEFEVGVIVDGHKW